MTNEERRDFVKNLFIILDMAGIKTIDDFTAEKLMNAFVLMMKEKDIRAEYKNRITVILKVLIKLVK